MSEATGTGTAVAEVLPGVTVAPQVIRTAVGDVEFDLTAGSGPVVLASGGPGGVYQARAALGWMDPRKYRLLSVSRPGYLGTPLASGRSIEAQAGMFAALLDALEIERTAVVTVSAGGPAGYLFAVRHPSRVSALVAISSVSGHHEMPETAGPVAQAIFMNPLTQRLTRILARRRPAWLLREILRSTGYVGKQQLRGQLAAALRSPGALAFTRALVDATIPFAPSKVGNDNDTALFGELTRLPLAQVRCPTLVVHGTHDSDVKFCDGVYAYEAIPGAERCWLDGGGHLAFWLGDRAAEVQATARAFLDRHSR